MRKALEVAETNPDLFRAECELLATKLGVGIEQVYQIAQNFQKNPQARRELQNFLIQRASKLARRAFGI